MAGGNPEPVQDTTLDGGLAGRTIHEAETGLSVFQGPEATVFHGSRGVGFQDFGVWGLGFRVLDLGF